MKYLRMLVYCGVLYKDYTKAERFREHLDKFIEGLDWLKHPDKYTAVWLDKDGEPEAWFTPPPNWRRHKV